MAIFVPRLTNHVVILSGLILADIFSSLGGDALAYAVLGAAGAFIGQVIYIAKRDSTDVENKLKFLYWRDILFAFGWMMVGGFFPLVLSLPEVPDKILFMPTPVLAILASPFIYLLWDVMEKRLPQALDNYLKKLEDKNNKNLEDKENKETKK